MRTHKTKILAIDPGTKEIGIALLEGKKLIYHGVKTISKNLPPRERVKEGKKIILRLIEDLNPDVLAVEKTYFAKIKHMAVLNRFVNDIKIIGKRKKLKVVTYTPNTVKKFVCGNGKAGKNEVAQVVLAHYPELAVYFRQDRKWKEKYHQNMFDAVAVGVMEAMGFLGKIQ